MQGESKKGMFTFFCAVASRQFSLVWFTCCCMVMTLSASLFAPSVAFFSCFVCAAVSQFFWRPRKKTGTFRCDVCGKPFSNKANMQRHKVLHATVRDVYFCDVCSRPFSWKSSLERHKRDMHAALAGGSGVQRNDSSRARGTFPNVRWHLSGTDQFRESFALAVLNGVGGTALRHTDLEC